MKTLINLLAVRSAAGFTILSGDVRPWAGVGRSLKNTRSPRLVIGPNLVALCPVAIFTLKQISALKHSQFIARTVTV